MFAVCHLIAAYSQQKLKLFSSTRYYSPAIRNKNLVLDTVRCIFVMYSRSVHLRNFNSYSSQSKDLLMCFSIPMMFELIHFDCSRMVLLAEVSAKWIYFDYLSLTSFDFCKSLIAACSQDSHNYCWPHIRCIFNLHI